MSERHERLHRTIEDSLDELHESQTEQRDPHEQVTERTEAPPAGSPQVRQAAKRGWLSFVAGEERSSERTEHLDGHDHGGDASPDEVIMEPRKRRRRKGWLFEGGDNGASGGCGGGCGGGN